MLCIFIISNHIKYSKNYANLCLASPNLLNYEYNVFLRKLLYFSSHKIFINVTGKASHISYK